MSLLLTGLLTLVAMALAVLLTFHFLSRRQPLPEVATDVAVPILLSVSLLLVLIAGAVGWVLGRRSVAQPSLTLQALDAGLRMMEPKGKSADALLQDLSQNQTLRSILVQTLTQVAQNQAQQAPGSGNPTFMLPSGSEVHLSPELIAQLVGPNVDPGSFQAQKTGSSQPATSDPGKASTPELPANLGIDPSMLKDLQASSGSTDQAAVSQLVSELATGLDTFKRGGQKDIDRERLMGSLRKALDKGTLNGMPQVRQLVEQALTQNSAAGNGSIPVETH